MLIRKPHDLCASDITPREVYLKRRTLLAGRRRSGRREDEKFRHAALCALSAEPDRPKQGPSHPGCSQVQRGGLVPRRP